MEADHWLTLVRGHPLDLGVRPHLEVELPIKLPCPLELLHPIFLDLFGRPFIIFVSVHHDGIICSVEICFLFDLSDFRVTPVYFV